MGLPQRLAFRRRLVELGYADYAAYLRSGHWKAVRVKLLASLSKRVCAGCRWPEELQVHHRSYARLGHERLSDVVLLCQACHAIVHDLERSGVGLSTATDGAIRAIRKSAQRGKRSPRYRRAKDRPPTGLDGPLGSNRARLR